MKTTQATTDNVQEPKREAQQQGTYRAPRRVSLGTAVGLVQNGSSGNVLDSYSGNARWYRY
jgi:hypothetical protein